jgi:hypothetical protein
VTTFIISTVLGQIERQHEVIVALESRVHELEETLTAMRQEAKATRMLWLCR